MRSRSNQPWRILLLLVRRGLQLRRGRRSRDCGITGAIRGALERIAVGFSFGDIAIVEHRVDRVSVSASVSVSVSRDDGLVAGPFAVEMNDRVSSRSPRSCTKRVGKGPKD